MKRIRMTLVGVEGGFGHILREPLIIINLSLPRRRESSDVKGFWISAFAGMTFLEVALIERGLRWSWQDEARP